MSVRAEVTERLGDGSAELFRAALDVWTEQGGSRPLPALAEAALDAVAPGAKAVERG